MRLKVRPPDVVEVRNVAIRCINVLANQCGGHHLPPHDARITRGRSFAEPFSSDWRYISQACRCVDCGVLFNPAGIKVEWRN